MVTFSTLGDILLQRYVTDTITEMQQLSAPVWGRLKQNKNFISGGPTGEGAYFAIRLSGNEVGGGWRATDDNTLPSAGNEFVKKARVRPKKLMNSFPSLVTCWEKHLQLLETPVIN